MNSTKQRQSMQVQYFKSSQLSQRLINEKKKYAKAHQEFVSNFDYDDVTQYYLLSSIFLRDWKKYTAFLQQDLLVTPTVGLPPQSYNLDLVFENAAGEKCLKQGLVQGQDYEIVSADMMKTFQNYKGQTIQKKAFKLLNGKKIVEIYDLQFTSFFLSQKIVNKIDIRGEHIKTLNKCRISRYETIKKFKKALLRQYDKEYIGSSAKEVRIWKMNKQMNIQKYEQYIKKISEKQASNCYQLKIAYATLFDRQDSIVDDIAISNDDILIIEIQQIEKLWVIIQGSNEDRCQFCTKIKVLSFQCECKLVRYCSLECQSNDVNYHRRKCNYADQIQLKQVIQFEFTSNSKRGVCGLSNLGNTCFMNSCLQCLSNTTLLTEYFISKQYVGQINKTNPIGTKGKLTVKYAKMIQALWCKESNSYSPSILKNAISEFQPMFSGYSQHDSQQLLSFLLDGLHQDLNKILQKPFVQCVDYNGEPDEVYAFESWKRYLMRNKSIICDIFMGQYKSKVVCPDCKFQSITFDPYSTISLPIPQVSKVYIQVFVFHQNFRESTRKISIDATVKSIKLWKQQVSKKLNLDINNIFFCILTSQGKCQKLDSDENLDHFIQASKKLQGVVIQESQYQQKLQNSMLVYVKFIRLALEMNQYVKHTIPYKRPFFLNFLKLNGQELYYRIFRFLYIPIFSNYFQTSQKVSETKIRQLFLKSFEIFEKAPFEIYLMSEPTQVKKYNENKIQINYQNEKLLEMNTQIHSLILNNDGGLKKVQIQVRLNKSLKEHIKKMYTYEDSNKFIKSNTKDLIIQTYDLIDCLRQFQKTETLEVGNEWRCPKCKDFKLAYKSMSLYKAPKVLILHLKRFKQKSSYYKSKINSLVNFPLQLDLQGFVVNKTLIEAYFKNQNPNVDSNQSTRYELFAVSNHYGGMGGGHYTAYAKNNNTWYDFNDSSVHQISFDNVVSSAAYMLFYKRID